MTKLTIAKPRDGVTASEPRPAGSGSRQARALRVFTCGAAQSGASTLACALASGLEADQFHIAEPEERGIERALSADCALLVVAADEGFSIENRRQCCKLSVLRAPGVILAVTKMDLVAFSQARFEEIAGDFNTFARELGLETISCVPVSSRRGEAIAATVGEMDWHLGPTLSSALQGLPAPNGRQGMPFRMTVESVDMSGSERSCTGAVLAGAVRAGDEIVIYPEGAPARVARVETDGPSPDQPGLGATASLVLSTAADISPGDVLAAKDDAPSIADQVSANLIWLGPEPMLPGRVYGLVSGPQHVTATVSALKHRLNVETLEHQAAKTLDAGAIGTCNLSISRPLVFDVDGAIRELGQFTLVDRETDATVGVGMIAFGLHRATNLKWQALDIDKSARAGIKGQRPCVLWFTGLSGAGKSSVANVLEKRLHASDRHTYLLDGDNVRHGLNRDLGFTDADRVENMRRVAETAKLLVDAGLIVMVSFISPFRMERLMARELFEDGEFIEIFVDAPMDVCEARDPKGLYKRARAGLVKNFTGIDSAYEPPESAEIHLDTTAATPDVLADEVVAVLQLRGLI